MKKKIKISKDYVGLHWALPTIAASRRSITVHVDNAGVNFGNVGCKGGSIARFSKYVNDCIKAKMGARPKGWAQKINKKRDEVECGGRVQSDFVRVRAEYMACIAFARAIEKELKWRPPKKRKVK